MLVTGLASATGLAFGGDSAILGELSVECHLNFVYFILFPVFLFRYSFADNLGILLLKSFQLGFILLPQLGATKYKSSYQN